MTARDEAIAAVARALPLSPNWFALDHAANAVDAIPPDVLARLAIEQGALVEVPVDWASDQDEDNYGPLYRVVEP